MSTSQEFEKFKAYLKQADAKGISLYDHLTNVILLLGQEQPVDALSAFEAISKNIKNNTLTPTVFKEISSISGEAERSRTEAIIQRISELIQAEPVAPPVPETMEEKKKIAANVAPDVMGDAALLEWAGVSLGEDTNYKLQCAMHLLVRQQADQGTPIVNVRFFGKIFGLRADYYIVEAKFESYDDIKTDVPLAQMEPPGTGANEYIYFAANHPEATWTQLPWVTAEMIQTSRQMRRFFTGNLMSSVLGYPRFPFGEAALLRAQLARIVAATSISPRGYYAADEDADDENAPPTISEEFEVPTAAELVTLESWVHHRPYVLNKQGRVIAYTEEKDNDVDDDADEEDEEEAPGQLNALEEDKQDDLKKMWILRQNPKGPHSVTTVTSLLWPGAVAACKGEKWSNIYVGFGHKYLAGLYTPPPPPPIQMEFKAEFDPDDEDDVDPIIEQVDPLPRGDEGGEGEGDEEDDEDDDD